MKRTTYLVRLRVAHRLYEDEPPAHRVIRATHDVEAIFIQREDAETYTRTHIPTYANPFGLGYELHLYNGPEIHLYHEVFSRCYGQPFYPNDRDHRISIRDYCDFIRQVGLLMPEKPQEYLASDWSLWWWRATRHLSFEEKKDLKTRLPIAAVYSNPLAWCQVIAASPRLNKERCLAFTRLHEFTRGELEDCLAPFQLPLESDTSTKQLYIWWESHQEDLSDVQRAKIWNLVDPYPYEIIEVELA